MAWVTGTVYRICFLLGDKICQIYKQLVKIHVVSDFNFITTHGWQFGCGGLELLMLMTVPGYSVICYVITVSDIHCLYIYITTVSVSLTQSGPWCIVDKACGLSANTLIRLLTALFDQNTLDDKNVYSSLFVSGRHIGSRDIAAL